MHGTSLLAHQPGRPDGLWTSWLPQPGVVVLVVLGGLLYARGVRAAGGRSGLVAVVRRRRRAGTAAVLVLVVALASPLEVAAGALFSAHMVQHLLLGAVAAPLLVLAAPVRTARRGLSPAGQQALDRFRVPVAGDGPVRRYSVLAATAAALVTLSAWHVPAAYDAALGSDLVHAVEHATILGSATAFWWAVIGAARRRQVLWAVGGLAVACLHGAALGALLALSPRPWYPLHAAGAEAWGLAALTDQQLAGAVMWVPTAPLYLAAIALIVHGWLQRAARSPGAPGRDPAGPARPAGAATSGAR